MWLRELEAMASPRLSLTCLLQTECHRELFFIINIPTEPAQCLRSLPQTMKIAVPLSQCSAPMTIRGLINIKALRRVPDMQHYVSVW